MNGTQIDEFIKEKLLSAVKESGKTQVQIRTEAGLGNATLTRYFSGERSGMTCSTLVKIANAVGKPVGYFFGEDTTPLLETDNKMDDTDYLSIPVYDVKASAGYGIEPLKNEDIIEMRLLSRSFLPRKNGEYHIIFVDGDSMTPTLKPNEPVLIDASIKNIASSGIYVLRINDGIFIKRLDRRPDGTIMVISDNKAYGDFTINDGTVLNIIGKAVLNFQML